MYINIFCTLDQLSNCLKINLATINRGKYFFIFIICISECIFVTFINEYSWFSHNTISKCIICWKFYYRRYVIMKIMSISLFHSTRQRAVNKLSQGTKPAVT